MAERHRGGIGLRGRLTGTAALVVVVTFAVGGVVLATVTKANVTSGIIASARARAADLADLVTTGTLPQPLPGQGDSTLAQVVSPSGGLLTWSAAIEGQGPLAGLRPPAGSTVEATLTQLAGSGDPGGEGDQANGEGPFHVVAIGVATAGGTATVLVAVSLRPVSQAAQALSLPLAIGFGLLLVVVVAIMWKLTGGALAPVEAIRSEAETISTADLHRRVPVPKVEDEIRQLAVTVNSMLARLEASVNRQRRFVADASHELRSPVAAIRTMLEVASRTIETVDLPRLLHDLTVENTRSEALVADLLLLTRADEAGRLTLRRQQIALADVLAEEITAAGARSTTPLHETIEAVPETRGDPEALRRMFRNLLENAMRHTRTGIWVTCRSDGDRIEITVGDDGPGIPPEDREKVFQRFVRLEDSRSRDSGGSGLGLPIARLIARSHGGDVTIVSPLHGGTTVRVTLPLTASAGHDRPLRSGDGTPPPGRSQNNS